MQQTTMTQARCDAEDDRGLGMNPQAWLWIALVAIGVCGRLWQPVWNVTPMAGVALAAGAFLPNGILAATAPLAALAIGNMVLPGYGSAAMAVVVFLATVWPVLLGRRLTEAVHRPGRHRLALAGGALASSLVFFLSTNLAHWWLTTDYPHSAAGLVACYVAALPFYRWMPVGDVVWTVVIFAGLAACLATVRPSRAASAA